MTTLLERGDKTKASAVHGFDAALRPPAVTDGSARRHDAVTQDGIADVLVGPELLEQFLSGDGAVAMLDKVGEDVKHLGLDLEQCPGVT
jgi:hypothetical protein